MRTPPLDAGEAARGEQTVTRVASFRGLRTVVFGVGASQTLPEHGPRPRAGRTVIVTDKVLVEQRSSANFVDLLEGGESRYGHSPNSGPARRTKRADRVACYKG